jgi:hypothetical protein
MMIGFVFADGVWEGAMQGALRGALIGGIAGLVMGVGAVVYRALKNRGKKPPDHDDTDTDESVRGRQP